MSIIWGQYRDDLKSDFAQAVDDCLGPLPDLWAVVQGLRTMDQQAALYSQGRDSAGNIIDSAAVVTYAKPGSSAHNYGLAIDVTLIVNGQQTWNYTRPEWRILWDAIRGSPSLHSGADFPVGETDPDHIERLRWWLYQPPPSSSQT